MSRICVQCNRLMPESHFKETKHIIITLGTREDRHKIYRAREYLLAQTFHGKRGKYTRAVLDLDPTEGTYLKDIPPPPPGAPERRGGGGAHNRARARRVRG